MSDKTLAMNQSPPLPQGTVLKHRSEHNLSANDYRIEHVLGEPGGFGITYKAEARMESNISGGLGTHREKVKVDVALKEFCMSGCRRERDGSVTMGTVDPETFEEFRRRFSEEAHLLAKFTHQRYIVRVLDIFQANKTSYMVMQYIRGNDLEHIARRGGPLNEQTAVKYIMQVAFDLMDVHKEDIVHRDIKPSNIMLMGDEHTPAGEKGSEKAMLIDFGAAKDYSDATSSVSTYNIHTAAYAAPEQVNPYGVKGTYTDIYALCATLYFLIEGKNPPPATKRDPVDPPMSLRYASPKLSKIINKGMSFQADDRYQICLDLIEALWDLDYAYELYENKVFYQKLTSPSHAPKVVDNRVQGEPLDGDTGKGPNRYIIAGATLVFVIAGVMVWQLAGSPGDIEEEPLTENVEQSTEEESPAEVDSRTAQEEPEEDVVGVEDDADPDPAPLQSSGEHAELRFATFEEALEATLKGEKRVEASEQLRGFFDSNAQISICYVELEFCETTDLDNFLNRAYSLDTFSRYGIGSSSPASGKLKTFTLNLYSE